MASRHHDGGTSATCNIASFVESSGAAHARLLQLGLATGRQDDPGSAVGALVAQLGKCSALMCTRAQPAPMRTLRWH